MLTVSKSDSQFEMDGVLTKACQLQKGLFKALIVFGKSWAKML